MGGLIETAKLKVVRFSLQRVLPALLILLAGLFSQAVGTYWLLRRLKTDPPPGAKFLRLVLLAGSGVFVVLMFLAFVARFPRFWHLLPSWWLGWGQGLMIIWTMLLVTWVAGHLLVAWIERLSLNTKTAQHSGRRNFLGALGMLAWAAPPGVVGYGAFIERNDLRLREIDIEIPGLPEDLNGLRLAQITDIHIGNYLDASQVARAVAMANETKPHVTLVTGDLLTRAGDPLDACLNELARLRAEAGIFGCMGNHEIYAVSQDYTFSEGARRGIDFLRQRAVPLTFGKSTLNLAGIDYQNTRRPYLVSADSMIVPGACNILLSHNPDVFPVAAGQGWDLTLAGHTHGGQVRVEILHADLNVARFNTRYVDGLYRIGDRSIFVSRGIGTIGVPVRLGAPPEVALVQLRGTNTRPLESRKMV